MASLQPRTLTITLCCAARRSNVDSAERSDKTLKLAPSRIKATTERRVGGSNPAPASTVEYYHSRDYINMRFTVFLAVASAALVAGAPVDNKEPNKALNTAPGSSPLPKSHPHFTPDGTFIPRPSGSIPPPPPPSGTNPPPPSGTPPPPPSGTPNPADGGPIKARRSGAPPPLDSGVPKPEQDHSSKPPPPPPFGTGPPPPPPSGTPNPEGGPLPPPPSGLPLPSGTFSPPPPTLSPSSLPKSA